MSINVIIQFSAKPEKRDSFKSLLTSVKTDLPTVKGCQGVDIYTHDENPDEFTLVESWDSKDSHSRHIEQVVASGGWDLLTEHLAKAPTSGYFRPL